MRSTRTYIHTDNLISNYHMIKNKCNNVAICAAVKADAYGHGAIEVSKILQLEGCNYFGVATIYEAIELIEANITKPIMLFSLPIPEELKYIVTYNIQPIVTTQNLIDLLEDECIKQNKKLNVHLKVDTGMGRIGCTPENAIVLANNIEKSQNLNLIGICTHLSTSELENQDYTNTQINKFSTVLQNLKQRGIEPEFIHAANSGGILKSSSSIFNMVRPGINLYGYSPTDNVIDNSLYKPVLELKTKIVELKKVPKGTSISYGRTYITEDECYIATIPVGYADGYFRALSNIGKVSINGNLYPIVGSICMDQMMIKVDSNIKLYDEVILIGIKPDQPNANTLAKEIKTICYEILTNIQRVKKIYIK